MSSMNARVIDPKSIDLEEFLTSWFGPKGDSVGTFESNLATLSAGLREWFDLISLWKIPLKGVKTLLLPSDMTEEDGKYIFMGDHGGWAWAFDPNVPQAVYEAKDDEPWRSLRAKWAEVFVYHVFTEAIQAAPVVTWCADISESDLGAVIGQFDEISFADSKWPGPGWRWYATDGLIADAGPKRAAHGRFAVTIGAKSREFVERLDLPSKAEWRVRENG
ncbi:hypothetical protein [Streptomyces sp. AS58]|uniref:hypothetical protein n=1 Tax=Streptomyces sp. AS58 TaxID=1519489 RepID=UPI00131C691D|nr:hypothetical protein [Streptomyces sp. AS58]